MSPCHSLLETDVFDRVPNSDARGHLNSGRFSSVSVADPKILKMGSGAENNLSAPSSFIANAHNDL